MSQRKINVLVKITDNKGREQTYRVRPLSASKLTLGITRAFRIARKAEHNDRQKDVTPEGDVVYIVAELATGEAQCSCEGFKGHGHCKHRDGLVASGFFQPELSRHVLKLEERLAWAMRELEEIREAPVRAHINEQIDNFDRETDRALGEEAKPIRKRARTRKQKATSKS